MIGILFLSMARQLCCLALAVCPAASLLALTTLAAVSTTVTVATTTITTAVAVTATTTTSWSPCVDTLGTRRNWVWTMQLATAGGLVQPLPQRRLQTPQCLAGV